MGTDRENIVDDIDSVSRRSLDFFAYFGLDAKCGTEDVRASYRRMAQQLHPDRGGDAKQFQLLQNNYKRALDFAKRRDQPTTPHNFQLSPFLNYDRVQRRFRLIASVVTGVLLIVLLFAWAFGFGLPTFVLILSVFVIVVGPVLASSFRPLQVGACFLTLGVLFLILVASSMTESDLLQFISGTDTDAETRNLQKMCILGFLAVAVFACGAGWVMSIANHDD